jgi:hypothetical protein
MTRSKQSARRATTNTNLDLDVHCKVKGDDGLKKGYHESHQQGKVRRTSSSSSRVQYYGTLCTYYSVVDDPASGSRPGFRLPGLVQGFGAPQISGWTWDRRG